MCIPSNLAAPECVCGTKQVLLVLADFPSYPHLSDPGEVSNLFFRRVALYFHDVSYGKLTIQGNATAWITLPKLYSQYVTADLRTGILAIAKDAFASASSTFNITSFDYIVLVLSIYPSLSGDFVQTTSLPIPTKSGSVGEFEVVEEDRDWSAYARGFALMLGLWKYQIQLSGFGALDLAANGVGDMSTLSKLELGWINDSQIVDENGPPIRRIVTLGTVEFLGTDPLAIRINLGEGQGTYWVEVRQPFGYDRDNLQQYGVVITYLRSSNASVEFRKTLQPDIISEATFLDPTADLSIIALNATQATFRVLLGDSQDGRDAQTALFAITRAQGAIQTAEFENRYDNLELAQTLWSDAHTQFTLGMFSQADALAISSETTANTATVPSDYPEAVQLLATAETLKNQTANLSSPSSALLAQANNQLDISTSAFDAKNFTSSIEAAQAAIELFNTAKQVDFTHTILIWFSNLGLIIPVVVLAFALRYQLKRDTGESAQSH